MERSNTHIRNIVHKYIAGEYTLEELRQLLAYLRQSDIDDFDEEAWLAWERILQNNTRPDEEEAAIAGKRAMQIVRQQQAAINTETPKSITRAKVFLRLAAVIAILVSISTALYFLFSTKTETTVPFASVTADRGQKKELKLIDGSAIHLNSESSITYPEHFYGDTREVSLSGEGFFDIAHDSVHAFIVTTSGIVVKVLGTTFNIKNYESDSILTITVSSGIVEVITADSHVYVLPDEQLNIHKSTGEFEKQHVNAVKYSLWRKGLLFFDHMPISEVVETIERRYNVDICFDCDSTILISGEHDNKSLKAVLDAICFTTGLKYRNASNCITLN